MRMKSLISIKLLDHSLSSVMIILRRSVVIQDKVDLAMQMKSLNDKKQFGKTLELFDKHKNNNIHTFSTFTIIQILKACANLRDIQRGSTIHHLLSAHLKDDSHIQVSLIHLYSMIQYNFLLFIFSSSSAMWECNTCSIIV